MKVFWSHADAETWWRLIEEPLPPPPPRLTRRVRYAVVGVDRDEDVAGVAYAYRGVSGEPMSEIVTLQLRDGEWHSVGAGGGSGDLLGDRVPSTIGDYAVVCSYSSTALGRERRLGRPHYVTVILFAISSEVERVSIKRAETARTIESPHRIVAVVVKDDRRPVVTVFGANEVLVPDLCELPEVKAELNRLRLQFRQPYVDAFEDQADRSRAHYRPKDD